MKAVKQEHFFGCAVACVATILKISYKNTLKSFDDGNERAKFRGFYCREIITALKTYGLNYALKYVGRRKHHKYPLGTIIHIKKSKKYPVGHYLVCTENGWMDSWINFPKLDARASFRKRLPGKPVYAVIPQ